MKKSTSVRLFSAFLVALSFTTVISTASAAVITAYPMNEGTGSTTADASGNANTASLIQSPVWTSGKYGNGLSFNGTNQYLEVPNSSSLDISGNKLTISMWVNMTTSTAGDYVLLGKEWIDNSFSQPYYQYGFEFSKNRMGLDLLFGDSAGTMHVLSSSNSIVTYGVWQFITVTYDGSNAKFYVNGVAKGTAAQTSNMVARGTMMRIGADGLANQEFKGKMDEIRVYNIAQTQAQIQTDMNTSLQADVTAPTTPTNVSGTSTLPTQATVSWTASTDAFGVSGYKIFRDSVQIATTTAVSFVNNGLTPSTVYSYTVSAFDAAGNVSTSSAPVVVTTKADTTLPTVSITSPTNNATVSNTISVTATSTDNVGVVGVQFKLDGNNLGAEDTSAPYTISWNTTSTTNGSHALMAVSRDAAGNTKTSTAINVTVSNTVPDITPPAASITAPANNATVSGATTVSATASDNIAVVGVRFKLDGVNLGAEDLTSPYSISWGTTSTSNGAHTLTAVARDAAGNTTTTNPITVNVSNAIPDTTPPSVPVNLQLVGVSQTTSTIMWDASTDNVAVTGYKVFRNGVQIATSTIRVFTDNSLTFNTTYTYKVSAFDAAANVSAQSAGLNVTTLQETVPPSVPTSLTATAISDTQINLSWTASTDNVAVTGYKIFRDGVQIATSTVTSYSDTGLAPSTLYTYKVSAFDGAGNVSAQSSSASATTFSAPDTTAPSVPTNLQISGISQTSLTLSWTASTDNVGVTGYQIFRDGVQIATTTQTSVLNNGLTASTTYLYTVAAFDAASNTSDTSAPVSVTTLAPSSGMYYSTTFPLTEDPISEGDMWLNGETDGIDWADVHTTSGLVYGGDQLVDWKDPTAVLKGNWGPDQTAIATVHSVNPNGGIYEELELRLRTTITPHSITGYEILYSARPGGPGWYPYVQIGRWDGAFGTYGPDLGFGLGPGLHDGDVVKATAIGNVVTMYINDVQILQGVDNTYTNGSPGVGFYGENGSNNTNYGFTNFTAYDTPSGDTSAPTVPAGLTATAVSASQINLSWTASTDNVAVTGYKIFRGGVQIATTASTSFSDTGLAPSTSYTYTVAAYDAATNTSAQSSGASATTQASSDTTAPSVPTNLSANVISSSQINLSWTASTDDVGVTGYRVFRNGSQVGTSASASYADTGLTASTAYTYAVSAYDAAANNSAQSSSVSATTTAQTGPTWSQVQSRDQVVSGPTNARAFASNNTAGDLIVVEVDWTGGSNFGSISDSQGNVYTQIGTEQTLPTTDLKSRLYYAKNINAGANTITTVISGSPQYHEIYIHEYSGVSLTNPLDTFSVNAATGGAFTSGNVTTASDNELLYGAEIDYAFASPAAGWTQRSNMDGNSIADKNAATSGPYAYTGSSSGAYVAWVAAFK